MNELKIFKFNDSEVRTTLINNEVYFVGKDIADVLGYSDLNKAIAMHVDEEDKLNDKSSLSLGQRGGWLINESGLYSLVLSSKLPQAKEFKHWVTKEVLPSIRKNGGYIANQENLTDEEIVANSLVVAERIIARKNAELEQKAKQIEEMQKLCNYADVVLRCPSLVDVTTIAQDYGLSAFAFNKELYELGIQHRVGKRWIINSKYLQGGYVQSETFTYEDKKGIKQARTLTKWTQKGRLFLYEKLKENGLLPLIERTE